MYQRALQGYEKALGHDRVKIYIPALNAMQNLATIYEQLGSADMSKGMHPHALDGLKVAFETFEQTVSGHSHNVSGIGRR